MQRFRVGNVELAFIRWGHGEKPAPIFIVELEGSDSVANNSSRVYEAAINRYGFNNAEVMLPVVYRDRTGSWLEILPPRIREVYEERGDLTLFRDWPRETLESERFRSDIERLNEEIRREREDGQ